MIDLFDYNTTAYNSALTMLKKEKRTSIIHPTGTGKSFIGFKLCEAYSTKRVCWLSPSEYIYKNQLENLVNTGAEIPQNITFYTYAKLMLLSTEELEAIQPDYIILDEFHRCGAQMWGRGVEALLALYKDAYVLGLSATHIRYLDNQRNMAEELFHGNVASEMTLGEAIVRGILSAPKYITTLYSYQEELERYEQRIQRAKNQYVQDSAEKYLESLRRTLEMAEGLDVIFQRHLQGKQDKYLVFCANKEHLDEMVRNVPQWFGKIDREPHIYSVYSDDLESEHSFQMFKEDESAHLKLLFCIDMLNEGVHVEGIAGIIMFRPTISPIVYKQQIGRALSTAGEKTPIIFDIVNNIENLYSIDAIEEEMAEAVTYYRENQKMEHIVTDKFTVLEEVHDCRQIFGKLNELLGQSWEMMYQLAKEYYEANGHLDIAKRYRTREGYSLGSWISIQRRVRRGEVAGTLDEHRIHLLDAIGMQWNNCLDEKYQNYLQSATCYYEANGHLDMETDYVTDEGVKLGSWISNVRRQYAMGNLSDERIQELEAMGMIWEKFTHLWELGYQAAEQHYQCYENLEVGATFADANGYKLGQWLNAQRRAYREGKLERKQIQALEAIQMQWESKHEAQWNQRYEEAKQYFEEYGNLDVPINYITETGFKLGDWLANHRGKSGISVTEERRARLDAIEMVWSKRDSWDDRYEIAKNFYQEHGHLRAPSQYKVEGIWLNKWLNEQKQIYLGNRAKKVMTYEQEQKMKAIGATWIVPQARGNRRCGDDYGFEVGV